MEHHHEAIFDDLDDDTARLAFADALHAAGERDRSAWVRLSCELGTLERGAERDRVATRCAELLESCRPDYWVEPSGVFSSARRGMLALWTEKSKTATKRLGKLKWLDRAHEELWLQGLEIRKCGNDGVAAIDAWKGPARSVPLFVDLVPQTGDAALRHLLG